MRQGHLRTSSAAMALAVTAWAGGCATLRPLIEPTFAARTYTPARIAVLPPDVFMIRDVYGDNDPQASAALGQAVTDETATFLGEELRQRGYGVDFSARWEGVRGRHGDLLVSDAELGGMANAVLRFGNSWAAESAGPIGEPRFVAPDLAYKIGTATESDALLYVNIKGVSVSSGKRTAQLVGVALFALVIVGIVLLMFADAKGGQGGGRGGPSGGAVSAGPRGVSSASMATSRAAPRYGDGPHFNVGVGIFVPIYGPMHTHDGQVADEDPAFASDDVRVSATLINARDGRVLWHLRDDVGADAAKPADVQMVVRRLLSHLPPSLGVSSRAQ